MSKNPTLKEKLFEHNNDYAFNPLQIISSSGIDAIPRLSIIIPYYNTGEIIHLTLTHLYNSIGFTKALFPEWKFEVLIVDDGSVHHPATNFIDTATFENLTIINNKANVGRTATRNVGLRSSQYDYCLFMDSDIVIDIQLITNHLKTITGCESITKNSCITVSFFEFITISSPILHAQRIYPANLRLNDYRLYCKYDNTWIGCDEDKQFVGREFRIVEETSEFRVWKGMFGPWALPNMILGGFFMVKRSDAVSLDGFDESFKGYGFTETSLPTKLIAIKNHFVIPVLVGGGLHISGLETELSKQEKDTIFKQKHDFYFNTYLNQIVI